MNGSVAAGVTVAVPGRAVVGRLGAVARLVTHVAVSLVVVSFCVFVMLDLAPGDAASTVAGPDASEAQVAQVRTALRLDEPLPVRYGGWLVDSVRGDFGDSLVSGRPVSDLVGHALPATISLTAFAMVLATTGAFLLGALPALRPGRWPDQIAATIAVVLVAFPPFWLAMLLVKTFAVDQRWLPALGYAPLADGPVEWARHLVLPAVVLAAQPAGELARQVRTALADVMDRDFVLACRAKGLGPRRVLLKHGLKNAAVQVVTIAGVRVAQLLGGTAIVETVFSVNGLGRLAVQAVVGRDVPVVIAIVVLTTLLVLVVNRAVEGSYGLFNPAMRHG